MFTRTYFDDINKLSVSINASPTTNSADGKEAISKFPWKMVSLLTENAAHDGLGDVGHNAEGGMLQQKLGTVSSISSTASTQQKITLSELVNELFEGCFLSDSPTKKGIALQEHELTTSTRFLTLFHLLEVLYLHTTGKYSLLYPYDLAISDRQLLRNKFYEHHHSLLSSTISGIVSPEKLLEDLFVSHLDTKTFQSQFQQQYASLGMFSWKYIFLKSEFATPSATPKKNITSTYPLRPMVEEINVLQNVISLFQLYSKNYQRLERIGAHYISLVRVYPEVCQKLLAQWSFMYQLQLYLTTWSLFRSLFIINSSHEHEEEVVVNALPSTYPSQIAFGRSSQLSASQVNGVSNAPKFQIDIYDVPDHVLSSVDNKQSHTAKQAQKIPPYYQSTQFDFHSLPDQNSDSHNSFLRMSASCNMSPIIVLPTIKRPEVTMQSPSSASDSRISQHFEEQVVLSATYTPLIESSYDVILLILQVLTYRY
jgi:hypothetical protein